MKVCLYARVSSLDQNVAQQVAYLKQWCSNQGYEVVRVISDEESGRLTLTERKQFKKLLVNPQAEAIVIFKLDRLTRNWADTVLLEQYFRDNWDKCRLISASEPVDLSNASGRFNFRVMMALNCYMPEDMLEKQKIGIDRAKKEGKYHGGKAGRKWI
jgi:DNA invertase Pin-like site-specific DNA recombinase